MLKQAGKRFPLDATTFYAAEIAAAMQFCHRYCNSTVIVATVSVFIRWLGLSASSRGCRSATGIVIDYRSCRYHIR